jgi:hypothetical protein
LDRALLIEPSSLLRHGREILSKVVTKIKERAAQTEQPGRTAASDPRRGRGRGVVWR